VKRELKGKSDDVGDVDVIVKRWENLTGKEAVLDAE
jgi:hypothetical protein